MLFQAWVPACCCHKQVRLLQVPSPDSVAFHSLSKPLAHQRRSKATRQQAFVGGKEREQLISHKMTGPNLRSFCELSPLLSTFYFSVCNLGSCPLTGLCPQVIGLRSGGGRVSGRRPVWQSGQRTRMTSGQTAQPRERCLTAPLKKFISCERDFRNAQGSSLTPKGTFITACPRDQPNCNDHSGTPISGQHV